MAVPISQAWTVATYVLGQKMKGRKRFPLVTMLEPLFRCNLACAGCGKIQYPAHILKQELTPEECFRAVEESGTPMVSIPAASPCFIPRSTRSLQAWWRARSTSTCARTRCFLKKNFTFSSPANICRSPSTLTASASTTTSPSAVRVDTTSRSKASRLRSPPASA